MLFACPLAVISFSGPKKLCIAQEKLKQKRVELLVMIPGGVVTSQLQPLDFCNNKPFKDYARKQYENWMYSQLCFFQTISKVEVRPVRGGGLYTGENIKL